MRKQQKYHHSVTENGNLQLRIVTEYIKDGKVIDKKYSDAYTPKNPKIMDGFDGRSKDIIAAITDKKVRLEFVSEQLASGRDALEQYKIGVAELVDYDRVIESDGKIAVRRITRIFDDGEEVSKKYHRSWIMPGDDPAGNDVLSKALAVKLHTPEVIAAYKAKMAEQAKEL